MQYAESAYLIWGVFLGCMTVVYGLYAVAMAKGSGVGSGVGTINNGENL